MPNEISREELVEWREATRGSKWDVHLPCGIWIGPCDVIRQHLALLDELEAARAVIEAADRLFVPNKWHSEVHPRCADCKGKLIGRRNGDLSCNHCNRWSDPDDDEESKHIEYFHPSKDLLRAYLAKYGKPAPEPPTP